MEISKEKYIKLKESYENGSITETAYKLGLIDPMAYFGYGVHNIKLYEKDGKFYFDYDIYGTCD